MEEIDYTLQCMKKNGPATGFVHAVYELQGH